MIFSSLDFVICFLPIFLCVYYLALNLCKKSTIIPNLIITIGSLGFYFYGAGLYSLVLIALGVVTYLLGRVMDSCGEKQRKASTKKWMLGLLVGINLAVLISYKLLLDSRIVGVGFYTCQMMSYGIDVYKGKIKAEKNVINMFTFNLMFPKLMQGPLVRYDSFQKRIRNRHVTLPVFDRTLKLFVYGLAMKVVVADQIGCLWSEVTKIGYESISTPLAWMAAFAYSFEIYFDFWGYSLMAKGLGGMLGFYIPDNFDQPYMSKSISEFWRRWHMTLGQWFRDYIYIPLGGNRNGKINLVINLFAVWIATSLWHGFHVHYIIWGMMIFAFIILEKFFLKKFLDKTKVLGRLYLWAIIPISWVIFAIPDLTMLKIYMARMFPFLSDFQPINVSNTDYITCARDYGLLFVVSIILCVPPVVRFFYKKLGKMYSGILALLLFVFCLYCLALGADNPFMYLKF